MERRGLRFNVLIREDGICYLNSCGLKQLCHSPRVMFTVTAQYAPKSAIHSRNLSFNDLRDWKVNPTNELQGLKKLDVTGNEHWLPSEQLLQLSNLTTVEGVRLSQYCKDCSLCKITSDDVNSSCSRDPELSSASDWRWHNEIQYGRALDFIKLGFWPRCLADDVCRIDQYRLPYFTSLHEVIIKSSLALCATGSVALLVNIAVVVFIVFHKSLRNDLAVRPLLNMAVCDALIALVAALWIRFDIVEMNMKYLRDQLQGNCYGSNVFVNKWEKLANIMGPILTCAVASHVFVSAIAMFEKFLKIVFALRPDMRLGRKAVVLSLCFSWSLSAAFAVLPVFGIGGMTYTDWLTTTSLPTDQMTRVQDGRYKQPIGFAAGSQIALVIFQLASFLLYVPIFIVAKKSGANVGVKREVAIARKIALLLCTNFIFFTVPVVVGVLRVAVADLNHHEYEDWRRFTLAEAQWYGLLFDILPVMCLSINSLLNPFLYSMRHPKVSQQLNPLLSRCGAATRECFETLRQNLRCHATNVEPINTEVEIWEGRIRQGASVVGERNNEVQSHPICPQHPSRASELSMVVASQDTRL